MNVNQPGKGETVLVTPLIGKESADMPAMEIPYWEKYMLTLREAAEYFHIGEKKMRQIAYDNMDAKFLLENGNRVMIKRKLFEEYLNNASVI
jgi:hypothetical protein